MSWIITGAFCFVVAYNSANSLHLILRVLRNVVVYCYIGWLYISRVSNRGITRCHMIAVIVSFHPLRIHRQYCGETHPRNQGYGSIYKHRLPTWDIIPCKRTSHWWIPALWARNVKNFIVSLFLTWISFWPNNWVFGILRRKDAHMSWE